MSQKRMGLKDSDETATEAERFEGNLRHLLTVTKDDLLAREASHNARRAHRRETRAEAVRRGRPAK